MSHPALFKERNVCLCAGERLEPASGPVRLSAEVRNRRLEELVLETRLDIAPGAGPNPIQGLIDLSYNMAAHEVEGNLALYQACALHGVALVAMKPFAGGKFFLSGDSVTLLWYQAGSGLKVEKRQPITPLQCLSYVLSQPVSTVVPGVKNADELRGDLRYLQATDEEKDYRSAIAAVKPFPMGQCNYCNHCLPCPQGIDIGQTIRLLDSVQGVPTDRLRADYAALAVKASECLEDGACMERCPNEVDVIAKMRQAALLYEG